jgi:hypothetical protein
MNVFKSVYDLTLYLIHMEWGFCVLEAYGEDV